MTPKPCSISLNHTILANRSNHVQTPHKTPVYYNSHIPKHPTIPRHSQTLQTTPTTATETRPLTGTHPDRYVTMEYGFVTLAYSNNSFDWKNSIDDIMSGFLNSLYTYRQPTSVLLLVAYAPLVLLALLGNALVIGALVTSRRMRVHATNYFLLNLAIADLLG